MTVSFKISEKQLIYKEPENKYLFAKIYIALISTLIFFFADIAFRNTIYIFVN